MPGFEAPGEFFGSTSPGGLATIPAPVVEGMPTDPNIVEIDGLSGSADRKPLAPSTFNDEFDQNTNGVPAGWTAFGVTGHIDTNTVLSNLNLLSPSNSGVTLNGIAKTAPAFPYTVTCKMTDSSVSAASQNAGLMVATATPATGVILTLSMSATGAALGCNVGAAKWSNATTFVAGEGTAGNYATLPIYFRMIVTATNNVTCQVSRNGLTWITLLNAFDPVATLATVGLFVNPQNVTAPQAFFDWIRFT